MNGVLQGIDVKSMGRIFVGLVKCGAWGCFDEFNRLEEAVLSAVSMQIQAIQNSLKNHRTSCELLGKEVTTHSHLGILAHRYLYGILHTGILNSCCLFSLSLCLSVRWSWTLTRGCL